MTYQVLTGKSERHRFLGGSDARVIMSPDETALIRLWKEKRGEAGTTRAGRSREGRIHRGPAASGGCDLRDRSRMPGFLSGVPMNSIPADGVSTSPW